MIRNRLLFLHCLENMLYLHRHTYVICILPQDNFIIMVLESRSEIQGIFKKKFKQVFEKKNTAHKVLDSQKNYNISKYNRLTSNRMTTIS